MDASRYKREVGSRLRMGIQAKGVSYAATAREIGVSPQRLGNWMRGDDFPDPVAMLRLYERYSITADWIWLGLVSGLPKALGDALWSAREASEAASPEPESQARENGTSSS